MVSIKISDELLSLVMSDFKNYSLPNDGEYVLLYAKKDGTDITLYESKKGHTLFLNGPKALEFAKKYDDNATLIEPKVKEKENYLSLNDQIGSDEVGVGDLCLPLVVCAAYVKKENVEALLALGVHDSKKMKDEEILRIVPIIATLVDFSKLTLPVEKYNELIAKSENLNSLKAKMHNQALLNMKKKHLNCKEIYVDQFVQESTYYKYLKNEKEIQKDIVFKTRGESSYISVAVSSLISRYSFLKEKEKLEKKYNIEFPFGAGKSADEFILKFKDKFGMDELKKISKLHFANLKEII